MRKVLWSGIIIGSGAIALTFQPLVELSAFSQTNTPTASSPNVSTQLFSPNAFKVPYLGYDGTFYLSADSKASMNDARNPKRIDIKKMETFTFYSDAAGKTPVARNCSYAYLGVVSDSKNYPESKGSLWDVFELQKDENQDPACTKFTYLTFIAPQGDPIHMHFRYGDSQSSFQALANMSNDPEDRAKFNPWWATYCGKKTSCGD